MKLESVACNLCGGNSVTPLIRQRDLLSDESTTFSVVRCSTCGLVYVNPRPAGADIAAFYTREFVSYQFRLYPKPASVRERIVSFVTESSALGKVKRVRALLGAANSSEQYPDLRVLDIGCGTGTFLYYLRERLGCYVAGVDFDKESVRYCRETLRLDVVDGTIASLGSGTAPYDVITMWHFLEHESDPLSALCAANRHAKAGNLLILEVPNVASLENAIFKENSYLYDIPRHLYHFSAATISGLLEKSGFEVQSISFPPFSGGFIGSVQNVLLGGRVYRKLKEHIFLFIAISLFFFPVEYMLGKTQRGSIMTVVAKKIRTV